MENITTIEELYRWRNANNLTGFYQKYSGQPNAQLDEEGNLFVCYDSEGRDVWVSPDGEIYSDTYSSLDESKTVKKNVVKLNEAQLRVVIRESVKKVLKESESDEIGEMAKAIYNEMNFILSHLTESYGEIIKSQAAHDYYVANYQKPFGELILKIQEIRDKAHELVPFKRTGLSQGDFTYDDLG